MATLTLEPWRFAWLRRREDAGAMPDFGPARESAPERLGKSEPLPAETRAPARAIPAVKMAARDVNVFYGEKQALKDIRLDVGKHPFAQGEGKHIGRLVLAAVPPVQSTHSPVADKQNAQFGIMKTDAPQQVPELCPERRYCQFLLLLSAFYPDVHCVSFPREIPCPDNQSGDGISR